MIGNSQVRLQISVQMASAPLTLRWMKSSVAADVGDAFDRIFPPRNSPGHPGLTLLASRAHIAPLAPDQGFIHLDDPDQRRPLKGVIAHGFADAVAQIQPVFLATPKVRDICLADIPFLDSHIRKIAANHLRSGRWESCMIVPEVTEK